MPTLTFRCGNLKCGLQYDSRQLEPKCPKCRSRKRQWVPVRVAIRAKATQVDRDLRTAAEQYGLTDLHTGIRQGDKMAPNRAKLPAGVARRDLVRHGELSVPVLRDADGKVVFAATCEPNGITSSVRPKMGVPVPVSGPDIMSNTVFEGRTVQRNVPLHDNP